MSPEASDRISFTDDALKELQDMLDRAQNVSDRFGKDSEEFGRVARSLIVSLGAMFRLGGRITRAWDFSGLEGFSPTGLNYGVVFHADRIKIEGKPVDEWPRDAFLGEYSVHS